MNPVPHASPRVSFGLPVRNGGSTISKAVESVLAQTFEDWELVISDNQSTDGTSEICRAYAAADARVRYVPTERDLSIHDNFRAAFYHSRGTYFRWCGDDDWLEPQYAERTVAALTTHPTSYCVRSSSSITATVLPCRCTTLSGLTATSARRTRLPGFASCCTSWNTAGSVSILCTHSFEGTSPLEQGFKGRSATATSSMRARLRSWARSRTFRKFWRTGGSRQPLQAASPGTSSNGSTRSSASPGRRRA